MMSWWRPKIREVDVKIDDDHSIRTTTDHSRASAKMAWTKTVGPTVRCEGSGKRGMRRAKGELMFRQCRWCRYAVQFGWGRKMVEHEREARGKERDG